MGWRSNEIIMGWNGMECRSNETIVGWNGMGWDGMKII